MKTALDPRHQKRRRIIQQLYAWDIDRRGLESSTSIDKIINQLENIDQKIVNSAPEWPLEKINKIDLAILRLGFFELLYASKISPKVIIDESIELGKEFGSENSPKFINAVLASFLNH